MNEEKIPRQSTCNQCKYGRPMGVDYHRVFCVKTNRAGAASRACYCDMFEHRLEGSSSELSPQGFKYRSKQIEDYRTQRQWADVGYKPKSDEKGHEMHASMLSTKTYTYYLPDEVEPMTGEEKCCATCRIREGSFCVVAGEHISLSSRCSEWDPVTYKKQPVTKQIISGRTVDDLSKVLCFDIETTGVNHKHDEILQLSIVNGNGVVLFDEYIKPRRKQSWPHAQKVHGIFPEMVDNKPTIDEYLPRLNHIFSSAELLVGYNIISFDMHFLNSAGVCFPDVIKVFDVMKEFQGISQKYSMTNQKLETCASFFGYEFKAHSSLEDALATLHCYLKMTQQNEKKATKIKVSEEERARRQDLGLPVTKPLRYMQHIVGGFTEKPVASYEILDASRPRGKRTVVLKLENGEERRVYEPYFADMQRPAFEEEMKKMSLEE